MVEEVESNLAQSYLTAKKEYDSILHAIRLARTHEVAESIVSALIDMKYARNKARIDGEDSILKSMPKSTNVTYIGEGWYGIRYLTDRNEIALKIEPILDASLIFRDTTKGDRNIKRTDLEAILPAIMDTSVLEQHKHIINVMASELLYDKGITIIASEDGIVLDGPVGFSAHARKRYVQRVLGIQGDMSAEEYQRNHIKQIEADLKPIYDRAEHVWTATDGIDYKFDPETNLMFVVGSNRVITLYEEDFGFSKDINRSIVYQQIGVIQQAFSDLQQVETEHGQLLRNLDDDISAIDDQMSLLQAKLQTLEAERTVLNATKNSSNKEVNEAYHKFVVESNKLFKKRDNGV